jgi:hypothetical protein
MHHLLAVIDTADQVCSAVEALTQGGFLESEIAIRTGVENADRMKESTGRGGLTGLAMRIASSLGLENEETETKDRYERQMRDGRYVVRVATPTDERKDVALQILNRHGAHDATYMGRFTIERLQTPDDVP